MGRQKKSERFNSFYIAYLIFGIQLISFLPTFLRLNVQPFLWTANILSLAFSLYIILSSVDSVSVTRRISVPLLLFLLIYSLRMWYDLFIRNIYGNSFPDPRTYLIYFYGLCLMPALAIFCIREINFNLVLKWAYSLLGLILMFSLISNLFLGGAMADDSVGDVSLRAGANQSIGSLTFGHLGTSFAILSFYRYLYESRNIVYILGICLGVFVIFLSGSRSPLLALFITGYILLSVKYGFWRIAVFSCIIILPFVIFWEEWINYLSSFDNRLIYRVVQAIEENKSSGRDVLYEQVLSQIARSPVLGDAFLVTEGEMVGFYPHNIFLEALLVTGVVGTLLFCMWFFGVLKKGYFILTGQYKHGWIFLLFVQFFVFGMLSKSFYTNQSFWHFGFLTLSYYWYIVNQNRNEKINL